MGRVGAVCFLGALRMLLGCPLERFPVVDFPKETGVNGSWPVGICEAIWFWVEHKSCHLIGLWACR